MLPVDPSQRQDLLSQETASTLLLFIATGAAALLWLLGHALRKRAPSLSRTAGGLPFFAVRTLLAASTLWLSLQTLGRLLVLETPWPLWVIALLGGGAVEALLALYRHEQTLVPRPVGRILLLLRVSAAILLILILAQPVFSRIRTREISRDVVVLVDDSDSMHLSDRDQTLRDRLAIARLFDPDLLREKPDLASPIEAWETRIAEVSRHLEALRRSADSAPDLRLQRFDPLERALSPFLTETGRQATETANRLRAAAELDGLPGELRRRLLELIRRLEESLPRHLDQTAIALDQANPGSLERALDSAREDVAELLRRLPSLSRDLDEAFLQRLSPEEKADIDRFANRPRFDIARQALRAPDEAGTLLLDALRERYSLRFIRFGRQPTELNPEPWLEGADPPVPETLPGFRRETNLAAGLEDALARVPPEALAGVLLLSDGRHNAELPVEDAARQLRAQGSPVCAIPVGSRIGPRDASILQISSPQSIYLGDRLSIRADLKLDGLRGMQVTARLWSGEQLIEKKVIDVPENQYRTTVPFAHTPEEKGIFDYRITVDPIEGELFDNNNHWEFKAAVSDDRTNVLLVDSYPRWEFRYLRNLFYGRDKSIHLQYVLLHPDEIRGHPGPERVFASATREFGEAEATHLPITEGEWRKFDAVIIGDVPPAAIDRETWRILRDSLSERGALVVFIAGPRFLPHAFTNSIARELFPIHYDPASITQSTPDEYRFTLTAAGAASPILRQSLSRTLNRQIWGSMPPLAWRIKPDAVKEGAEVLAYASPEPPAEAESSGSAIVTGDPDEVQAALERLAHQKEFEEDNALLVTQRFGLGRIAMLNFDTTWRFRYGVGDTYHHRFWGQLMRWGSGVNLRSGGDFARIGTDQLSYSPYAPIKVTARILDRDRQPYTGSGVFVALYQDGRRLQRRPLSYREDSNGVFEGQLSPLAVEGNYRLVLEGEPAERAAMLSGLDTVETELRVATVRDSLEVSELTADHDFLAATASLSGGILAPLSDPHAVLPAFGAPRETLQERHDYQLWDTFPLLLLFLSLLTLEWIFRRGTGLV